MELPKGMRQYFRFMHDHARFLAFGFTLTFFCNFGQTFFIGLYNSAMRDEFGLSHGEMGSLYGIATLCSAALLVWVGRLIDHVDLRIYTITVVVGLAVACGFMYIGESIILLGLTLGMLRLSGQGLMPHISSTSMARYFEASRGQALSITFMGISLGQVVLPGLAIALIASMGWRESWGVYGLVLAVGILPLLLVFLKGHGERHRQWEAEMTVAEAQSGAHSRMKSPLKESVLTDKRFYMIMPGFLSFPLFATAIFFFQEDLLRVKDWDAHLFAFSFPFFAATTTIFTLVGGYVVDKIGDSLKLLPMTTLPFILGVVVLAYAEASFWLPAMMAVMGIGAGMFSIVSGTLWAEMYGTRALGAIRALVTSLIVLGTAIMPALLGFLYDLGISISASYLGFAAYMLVFTLLQLPLMRGKEAENASHTPQ